MTRDEFMKLLELQNIPAWVDAKLMLEFDRLRDENAHLRRVVEAARNAFVLSNGRAARALGDALRAYDAALKALGEGENDKG